MAATLTSSVCCQDGRSDIDTGCASCQCAASSTRVVRLTFKGAATYRPLLGEVVRRFGVDFSILAGRIDHIKDVPYGQLTLSLVGGDVEEALRALAEAGVDVEVLR